MKEIVRYLLHSACWLALGLTIGLRMRPKEIASIPAESIRKEIVIKDNKVVAISDKKRVEKFVPEEGKTQVIIKKDGGVSVVVKNKGFCFRPGVGVGLAHSRLCPVLDLRFCFWDRFGASIGVVPTRRDAGNPYIALNYSLVRNTHVFLGLDTKKRGIIGLRVSF